MGYVLDMDGRLRNFADAGLVGRQCWLDPLHPIPEVLAGPEYFKMAREACRHHHERCDGKGYPDGLKGEDIPLAARIVSLADAYDAIVSDRPYRKARTHEQALSIIIQESGRQFCPDVVKAFAARERDFHALSRSTL